MYEDLMEQVVTPDNARAAWLAVKRNGGAPGIDGMTTQKLRDHVRQHWETIRAKLVAGTYVPSPVRRVEIPKPNGGVRLLGIPTVLDRWIQSRPGGTSAKAASHPATAGPHLPCSELGLATG